MERYERKFKESSSLFLVATQPIVTGGRIYQPGAVFQVAIDDVGRGGYQARFAYESEYPGNKEPLPMSKEDMEYNDELVFVSANDVVKAKNWKDAIRLQVKYVD